MARVHFWGRAVDSYGNIQPSEDITIYLAGTETAATTYTAQSGGTGNSTAPQVTTDSTGRFNFWVDHDDYTYPGFNQLFDIIVGDLTYSNVDVFRLAIVGDEINANRERMDYRDLAVSGAVDDLRSWVLEKVFSVGIPSASDIEGYPITVSAGMDNLHSWVNNRVYGTGTNNYPTSVSAGMDDLKWLLFSPARASVSAGPGNVIRGSGFLASAGIQIDDLRGRIFTLEASAKGEYDELRDYIDAGDTAVSAAANDLHSWVLHRVYGVPSAAGAFWDDNYSTSVSAGMDDTHHDLITLGASANNRFSSLTTWANWRLATVSGALDDQRSWAQVQNLILSAGMDDTRNNLITLGTSANTRFNDLRNYVDINDQAVSAGADDIRNDLITLGVSANTRFNDLRNYVDVNDASVSAALNDQRSWAQVQNLILSAGMDDTRYDLITLGTSANTRFNDLRNYVDVNDQAVSGALDDQRSWANLQLATVSGALDDQRSWVLSYTAATSATVSAAAIEQHNRILELARISDDRIQDGNVIVRVRNDEQKVLVSASEGIEYPSFANIKIGKEVDNLNNLVINATNNIHLSAGPAQDGTLYTPRGIYAGDQNNNNSAELRLYGGSSTAGGQVQFIKGTGAAGNATDFKATAGDGYFQIGPNYDVDALKFDDNTRLRWQFTDRKGFDLGGTSSPLASFNIVNSHQKTDGLAITTTNDIHVSGGSGLYVPTHFATGNLASFRDTFGEGLAQIDLGGTYSIVELRGERTSHATALYGAYYYIENTDSGGAANTVAFAAIGESTAQSALGDLIGADIYVQASNDPFTANLLQGLQTGSTNTGDNSTITEMKGSFTYITVGTGMTAMTATTMVVNDNKLFRFGSGEVNATDGYSIRIQEPGMSTTGTAHNLYGLYIGDHSGKNWLRHWNLYSDGVNSRNYFAGAVSAADLTVTGTLTVEGGIDLPENQIGQQVLVSGAPSAAVAFSTVQVNDSYTISHSLVNTVDRPPSVYSMTVIQKNVDGFRVLFSGNLDSDNYRLDWAAIR
jgi:hypothetical protein